MTYAALVWMRDKASDSLERTHIQYCWASGYGRCTVKADGHVASTSSSKTANHCAQASNDSSNISSAAMMGNMLSEAGGLIACGLARGRALPSKLAVLLMVLGQRGLCMR